MFRIRHLIPNNMVCWIRGSSEIELSVEGTYQFLGLLPRSDKLYNHSIPTNRSAPRANYQCIINLCYMDRVNNLIDFFHVRAVAWETGPWGYRLGMLVVFYNNYFQRKCKLSYIGVGVCLWPIDPVPDYSPLLPTSNTTL